MKSSAVVFSLLTLLAGCTTLPSMPKDNPGDISKLADFVECEIQKTFADRTVTGRFDFSNWTSTYTITENVTSNDDANIDPLKWLSPAGVDHLFYSANANASREAYRNGKVDYSVYVVEPKSTACNRISNYKNVHVDVSKFKLRDWVFQVSSNPERQMSGFSYSVKVTVVTGVGVGSDFADGKWVATDGLSRTRTTIETIDFSFSQKLEKAGPTKVIVVAPIPEKTKPLEHQVPHNVPYGENLLPGPTPRPKAKTQEGPRIVPDSAIRQNLQLQQMQQFDRIKPNLLDN